MLYFFDLLRSFLLLPVYFSDEIVDGSGLLEILDHLLGVMNFSGDVFDLFLNAGTSLIAGWFDIFLVIAFVYLILFRPSLELLYSIHIFLNDVMRSIACDALDFRSQVDFMRHVEADTASNVLASATVIVITVGFAFFCFLIGSF